MSGEQYAQIQYDRDDLEQVTVKEVSILTDDSEKVPKGLPEEKLAEQADPAEVEKIEPDGENGQEDFQTQFHALEDSLERVYGTLRRLEKKFDTEILNSAAKDSMVKAMHQELNEYKAGLVEKALKNVLYDIADMRELMFAKARHAKEKEGADTISLDEFVSYADDMGDILEKYDVVIYKGEAGGENVAVRQKIARKIETEDPSMVKKVAESLSYGYEYNGKVLYPEKISVYVKKTEETEKTKEAGEDGK